MSEQMAFQYVVLRCVPRADREEFVNVGVVVYCQQADFLDCAARVDEDRIRALAPDVDLHAIRSAVSAISAVCRGEASANAAGRTALGTRFGFLSAPRSTVLQPGPIHGGLTSDPAGQLARLLETLVS
jgi:hypothetical protein